MKMKRGALELLFTEGPRIWSYGTDYITAVLHLQLLATLTSFDCCLRLTGTVMRTVLCSVTVSTVISTHAHTHTYTNSCYMWTAACRGLFNATELTELKSQFSSVQLVDVNLSHNKQQWFDPVLGWTSQSVRSRSIWRHATFGESAYRLI